MTLEAGKIVPLDEIYKNAFNLLIGGQGQGKTYHAEDLIARNRHHFSVIKRFSPVGTSSLTDSDGDLSALLQFCAQRTAECEQRKRDANAARILLRAVREGRPALLGEHGINAGKLEDLMKRYGGVDEIAKIEPVLVFIDDMGGDKSLKDSRLFNQVARQLRHLHMTVIFNAHRFKDLPPLVRDNTQTVFLHGGLSQTDLKQLWDERGLPGGRKREELFRRYEEATSEPYGYLGIDYFGKKKRPMPNPLGKNERGFFGNKGGAPGQCGSTPLPEKKEKKKEAPTTGQKKGDPEVKRLLQTLIGVKRSRERAAGKPSSRKQNVN